MKEKRHFFILFNFFISVLFIQALLLGKLLTPILCQAQTNSPKTIRIGWYDYEGIFSEDENGSRSGYGYDYLQELAKYGGWKYEYINGTISECVQMLQEGKIDLIGSVMYAKEREETMDFSHLSMGNSFSVLTVNADNSKFQKNDFTNFNGLHIGILESDIRIHELEKFAAENQFTYTITQYSTPALMEDALYSNKIDAILATDLRVTNAPERIIAQFSPT